MTQIDNKKDSNVNISILHVNSTNDSSTVMAANLENLLQESILVIGQSMKQSNGFEVRAIYDNDGNILGSFKWSLKEVIIEDTYSNQLINLVSPCSSPKSSFQNLVSHFFHTPTYTPKSVPPFVIPNDHSQEETKWSTKDDSALFIINFDNFGTNLPYNQRLSVFKTITTIYFNYYNKDN